MGKKSKLIVSMTATAGVCNPNNAQGLMRAVIVVRCSVPSLGSTRLSAVDDAAQAKRCAAFVVK